MPDIGTLRKFEDLRTIWKHEEKDFSIWLALEENLAMLSEEIGIDLVKEELESPVGGYSVDILGVEEGTARRFIIENQLEDTNHDHLGKIITYAAGKDAEVIIWIVKRARDEHRQAVDWLNNHTDEKIGIFLIEIELWQIGDSSPAPKFKIISQPNEFTKIMKTGGLSQTQQIQYDFWKGFVEYAGNDADYKTKINPIRTPKPERLYRVGIGRNNAFIFLRTNSKNKTISAGITIRNNEDLYNLCLSNQSDIEKELGSTMDWQPNPNRKRYRIVTTINGDITDKNKWPDYYKWYVEKTLKLRDIIIRYYQ